MFNRAKQFEMGSARVSRVSSGVAPELSPHIIQNFPDTEKWFNKVFGATPKTARQTRALPKTNSAA
jgi:hypothetical protein